MDERCDVLVVGNGMFGSATARHLAEMGRDVVCVGAPNVGSDAVHERHATVPDHRVYSSHHDAARLTGQFERHPEWADATNRAISGYRSLEQASGVSFYYDVGYLIASRPGGDGKHADPRPPDFPGTRERFEPGDTAWRQRWPMLQFADTHYVAHEPSPAGYILPKRLIAAQNVLMQSSGGRLIADTVTGVGRSADGYRATTADGHTVDATHVVICAGAFCNFNNLLPADVTPTPAPIRLKSETIVLGEVSAADAERVAGAPTVKYLIEHPDIDDIYMTPPVRYDDGKHYVKLGANTRLDQWFTSLDEVQRWFNTDTDTDTDYLGFYEPVLRDLWPTIDFASVHTRGCIVTYTESGVPLIDQVADGLFVVTAGNGSGAKSSDGWGQIAAEYVARHG